VPSEGNGTSNASGVTLERLTRVEPRKLEDSGVIERRRYCERPPRDEYVLTVAGQELAPVLRAMRIWGERHATPRG